MINRPHNVLLLLISTLFSVLLSAAEIDSVTPRNLPLDNALGAINTVFNQRISAAVHSANPEAIEDQGAHCDEEALYLQLRKAIFQTYTPYWGLMGYSLDQQMRELLVKHSYSLSLNDSIYRDLDYLEAFSLNLKELSDVVNINGHLIGVDKIGHFFAEGWQYFSRTQEKQSLQQSLQWGKEQEQGKFGYVTTGVFSFADLTANFNGWLFWNRVLLKQANPLYGAVTHFFSAPYVSCDLKLMASLQQQRPIRRWVVNQSFDFSDYVDGVWDEGNNCNSYKDPMIEQKVRTRITEVNPQFRCPHQVDECLEGRQKYRHFSKYLLHPFCLIQ
jgi:hypothetical protein